MKVAINKGCCDTIDIALDILGLWGNDITDEEFLKAENFPRNDSRLIKRIEDGQKNGLYHYVKIVEIPDDVDFVIEDYDGNEWVSEKHRTWR